MQSSALVPQCSSQNNSLALPLGVTVFVGLDSFGGVRVGIIFSQKVSETQLNQQLASRGQTKKPVGSLKSTAFEGPGKAAYARIPATHVSGVSCCALPIVVDLTFVIFSRALVEFVFHLIR